MTDTVENRITTETPLYTHSCSCCTFLGRHHSRGEDWDLYVHGAGHPTVLARWGCEGPEYTSGLEGSYNHGSPLIEARVRAQKLGLLEYDAYQALHYAMPGSAPYQEMLAALPDTVEHQAWLALKEGNTVRSQKLATDLFNRERTKTYNKDRSDGYCLLDVEARLAKVLSTLNKGGTAGSYFEAELVTEFLWPANSSGIEA